MYYDVSIPSVIIMNIKSYPYPSFILMFNQNAYNPSPLKIITPLVFNNDILSELFYN